MGFKFTAKKQGKQYAEVTGYDGEVRTLCIPDTAEAAEGLPVRSLGDHAFSGRNDIREVIIPDSVTRIGRFCFYDCGSLERITLTDSVNDYYDGAIRSCPALRMITVRIRHGAYRVVKDMADDERNVLHFQLEIFPDGGKPEGAMSRVSGYREPESGDTGLQEQRLQIVRLTIPAYHDEDREDTMARAIHPKIVGAGYAYRQTITREGVNYREYDSLFPKACDDDKNTAVDIALDRLGYSHQLAEEFRTAYIAFLSNHAAEALTRVVRSGDTDGLECFLDHAEPSREAVNDAVDLASSCGHAETVGLLMAYERTHFSVRPQIFSL